jgi:transketolase
VRAELVRTLIELAHGDERVMLLTGDLGFMALEPFAQAFPRRFFNVGVAEQNMVGIATGLAEAGFVPFVYSIATFASMRPFEFIRNGPVQHRLPVRVVGMGGGFEYGTAGHSHHALEDVGLMRTQPGLAVIAPADSKQARSALLATWNLPGPIYYRLGKDDRAEVPGLDGRFELGRTQLVRPGTQLLLIALGSITVEVAKAADLLARRGVSAEVRVVASIAPAPVADLAEALARFPLAIAVEAHHPSGGLGSLVAEVIAERGIPCRLIRAAVAEMPRGISGSTAFLHGLAGLSAERLAERALAALEERAR